MGKRATRGKRGRSAVAKQKHWDKLTLKHVEKFIDDIKQNSAKRQDKRRCCMIMDGIQANHHWHRVLHPLKMTVMTHLLQQS